MSMPLSWSTRTVYGLMPFGDVPALCTSNASPPARFSRAAPMMLRAEFPVHRKSTRIAATLHAARLRPERVPDRPHVPARRPRPHLRRSQPVVITIVRAVRQEVRHPDIDQQHGHVVIVAVRADHVRVAPPAPEL